MARSRPISYHLKKSCTREKQVQKAQEWAKQWHDETFELLKQLNDNASGRNDDAFDAAMHRLRLLNQRKHEALGNIFNILTQPIYSETTDADD